MQKFPKVRLLYILYNENLIFSGILASQVRKLLILMSDHPEMDSIRLMSFVNPVSLIRKREEWRSLRTELAVKNIILLLRPMFIPLRWSWILTFPALLFCLLFVLFDNYRFKSNVIHSRSYGSALVGLMASLLTGGIHIFDPRGPLPEEFALNGAWRRGGSNYRFWKWIEGILVRNSNAVIAVTPYFKELFRKQGARKAVFVPNRGDVGFFLDQTAAEVQTGHPLMLFTGEMQAIWNNPDRVAKHYLKLKSIIPDLKLKVITRREREFVEKNMREAGMNDKDWIHVSSSPRDMPANMNGCSTGLILGQKITGDNFYWTVWPVKFAEYVAAGIPVIVESNAGPQLIHEIEKYGIGAVIDENDTSSYHRAADLIKSSRDYRVICREYARRRMGISRSADQYIRLYRQELRRLWQPAVL